MTADGPPTLTDGVVTLRDEDGRFDIAVGGHAVGWVSISGTGDLGWYVLESERGRGYASRAVRLLVSYAFTPLPRGLGLERVQAHVDARDAVAIRVGRRAGLRNEGLIRQPPSPGGPDSYLLLGRLRDDPEPADRKGFRALLNSFLPRKRVIAQVLVRDRDGRVLLCHPTYKDDWDLPGGVVEPQEAPHDAARREVLEELALDLPLGGLVLTDWLPPWSGWDDALSLVFDGGVRDPSILDGVLLQAREIREVAFCTAQEVRERCADYTARRVEAALAALDGRGTDYTHSGRQP